jgi:hypothetical protein
LAAEVDLPAAGNQTGSMKPTTPLNPGLRPSLPACVLWVVLAPPATNGAEEPAASISQATIDVQGLLRHEVQSAYQSGTTTIRVLRPDSAARCRRAYRVLLVLPVEPGEGQHFGDGLAEIKRLDLHNRYQLICVQPTFSHLPWYADHPSDPQIRQEAYLLNVVMPFLKYRYPVARGSANWLLLGFSKSGWGAWSLLLRHPELFGRAAAWDAPLAMTAPDKYRMGPIFGTQQNFERYEILAALQRNATWLRAPARLGLFGIGNFKDQHEVIHARLVELGIAHAYRDAPRREHTWTSGWIPEAVEFLTSCSAVR